MVYVFIALFKFYQGRIYLEGIKSLQKLDDDDIFIEYHSLIYTTVTAE